MRTLGFFLSLLLHIAVIVGAYFYSTTITPPKVDLNRKVYKVDLVALAPKPKASSKPVVAVAPKPAAQPKPVAEIKQPEPKPAPKPAPQPEPKPVPKPAPKPAPKPEPKAKDISTKKKTSVLPKKPKEEPKPVPKPAPKPAPKPKPKPQKSEKQVLAEGLADVRKLVAAKEKARVDSLKDELASLRENEAVGADVAAQPGEMSSGLSEVYALIVGSAIKENWRYPVYAGEANLACTVELHLEADGLIKHALLVTKSGNPEFDSSALRAVRETERVEPPRAERDKIIRINFNSQELSE